MKPRKVLAKALASPANLRFAEIQRLAEAFGFQLLRISGSHHIYGRLGLPEQINLQDVEGKAKPYQVRQLLRLVERYNLQIKDQVMRDYHINIFYSDDDGGYIADIPDLESCSAFGSTAAEALAQVQIAKSAWLEANKSSGRTPPPPRYRPAIYQAQVE